MAKTNNTMGEYQGGYSSLKPSYGDVFTGYRVSAGELGAPTSIQTANQLMEVNNMLNQGIIPIEIGTIDPNIFEQIPKQHFKEINRQAKLTGAKISMHAPLIEPSGIDPEQRRPWDKSYRELAENQLKSVMEKAHDANPSGQMPVTIHASGIPGTEFKMTADGKKIDQLVVINRETGKMVPLQEEAKYYPGEERVKEKIYSPDKQLEILNHTEWDNSLSQVEFNRENAERILSDTHPIFNELYLNVMKSEMQGKQFERQLSAEEIEQIKKIHSASEYMKQADMTANALFTKAYKLAKDDNNQETLNRLNMLSKQYGEQLAMKDGKRGLASLNPKVQSQAMFSLIQGLQTITPNIHLPIEKFALDKSAKTFANVAFHSFKKYGDEAPRVSIENFHPGTAFAYGEGMNDLVLKSKEEFVKKAVNEGYSESGAKRQADKLLSVTFDMGHLNIAKKKGFKDEDLVKEAEMFAKHVGHVHLADNFGYTDSHLPPGMGNVPHKELFEVLKKQGFKGTKIVEAGAFVQQFKTSPVPYSLEGMGSPMYAEGVGPYWNQAIGLQQGYSSGYGMMLPDINYQMFGAGFSQLPSELGGQRPGAEGSRMSGRGME